MCCCAVSSAWPETVALCIPREFGLTSMFCDCVVLYCCVWVFSSRFGTSAGMSSCFVPSARSRSPGACALHRNNVRCEEKSNTGIRARTAFTALAPVPLLLSGSANGLIASRSFRNHFKDSREAYIPTKYPSSCQETRVSRSHGHGRWSRRTEGSSCKRTGSDFSVSRCLDLVGCRDDQLFFGSALPAVAFE